MMHVGDIMSTVGVFSTVGGYSVLWGYSNNKRCILPTCIMISSHDTEHPSWYCTHVIQRDKQKNLRLLFL